jgi:hypothetical protein
LSAKYESSDIHMKPKYYAALRAAAEKLNQAFSQNQKVCARQCDQCLFSKNKLVDEERKQELLSQCERDQTHFICHKGSTVGQNVVCNGFFRNKTTPFLEIMKATNKIEFVQPLDLQKLSPVTGPKQKKVRKGGQKKKNM